MTVLSVQLVNISINEYKLVSTTVAMKGRGGKEKLRDKEMERNKMKQAESLMALHTHTHTHTDIYIKKNKLV